MGRILLVTIPPFKFRFNITRTKHYEVIAYRDLVLQNPRSFLAPDTRRFQSASNLDFVCKKPSGVQADAVELHFWIHLMSRHEVYQDL